MDSAHHSDTAALSEVIRYSNELLTYISNNGFSYIYQNYYYSNLAHAYWLRNQGNDRALATEAYENFLSDGSAESKDGILKDLRDLRRAGLIWPNLKELLELLKPMGVEPTPAEWQELGL